MSRKWIGWGSDGAQNIGWSPKTAGGENFGGKRSKSEEKKLEIVLEKIAFLPAAGAKFFDVYRVLGPHEATLDTQGGVGGVSQKWIGWRGWSQLFHRMDPLWVHLPGQHF